MFLLASHPRKKENRKPKTDKQKKRRHSCAGPAQAAGGKKGKGKRTRRIKEKKRVDKMGVGLSDARWVLLPPRARAEMCWRWMGRAGRRRHAARARDRHPSPCVSLPLQIFFIELTERGVRAKRHLCARPPRRAAMARWKKKVRGGRGGGGAASGVTAAGAKNGYIKRKKKKRKAFADSVRRRQ